MIQGGIIMAFNKSSLSTYTIANQTVAAGSYVRFDINRVHTGCSIRHCPGGSVITLASAGLYSGAFNANFTATTTGPVTFQLYRNGVAVPGAEATHQATAAVPIAVAFPILELVRPSCVAVDNTGTLQVQVSAAGVVNTTNIDLVKDA